MVHDSPLIYSIINSVEKSMKFRTIIIMGIIFLIGMGILLYPTVSDYINQLEQSRRIEEYDQTVATFSQQDYKNFMDKAIKYNEALLLKENRFKLSEEEKKEYDSILNVSGDGIMGYVEIKKLGIKLSIGHGISEEVLEKGVGHLEGSSMPCGGESTHTALVGHRGLPSAELFTDLDQMKEGDIFTIHVLNQVLTYQVDQIKVVEPDDMSALEIVEGKDYATLITCTPYAVNSHRLLVRGVRIENIDEDAIDSSLDSENKEIVWKKYAPVIVAGVLAIVFVIVILKVRKRRE